MALLGYRCTHFSLAPSPRQEDLLEFDTSVPANGTGILIQYKRAYVSGSLWTWHLNRTSLQDQHLRLQTLESLGFPVLYALPLFHTYQEIQTKRWQLLKATLWYRPSQITLPGGSVGHHDIRYDASTGRGWVVSQEKVELLPSPENPGILIKLLDSENNKGNLQRLLETFNTVMTRDIKKSLWTFKKNHLESLLQSVSIVIKV